MIVPDSVPTSGARLVRSSLWLFLAGLLVVCGVVGSMLAAGSVATHDAATSREGFERSSADVASTLRLAIQRDEDLVTSAVGFFLGHPDATNAEFAEWAGWVQASTRYPELLGWGEVLIVPADDLESVVARIALDPTGLAGDRSFVLVPPGDRPFYCLMVVAQAWSNPVAVPPGFDFCAGPQGAPIVAARDTGKSSYQTFDVGTGAILAVQVPFYRDGVTPETVEARREAFVGWVGLGFDPDVVLALALRDHPGTALALRFQDGFSDVEVASGQAAVGADSVVVDLGNGWTVETFGPVPADGVFANGAALLVLIAGVALSVVFSVLVLVLGTGRVRALRLVAQRTGELRHQALHDALTGLPNRALIMDRIEQLLARNRRNETTGAALYIDLDDFKNVNDTLGHEAGDRLLVAVAARLTTTLRDADTIGRMGGDEFVVLIDDAKLAAAPELIAERLLEVMRQPFQLGGAAMPLTVNTSIGIAIGDRATGGNLLRDADVALYEAKGAGKNRYEIFLPEMHAEISRRIELEFDLRSAVDAGQFRVVYQPIYSLDDLTIVGVEALLRWDHPTLGLVEPDEIIPILEQTGQIREVGRWVLDQACQQTATWQAHGHTLDISVNVSGRQLDHDSFIDDIRGALDRSGLDPTSLIIEVTETALMRNTTATAGRLEAIKALGVRIAVDDFGTGYSSLAYLQQFPVDCLKIDRRFTNAITASPESIAIISTLVQLGKALGLQILAEGVETTSELDHLRGENVNQAQGFLLSHPLDPQTLEARLLEPSRKTLAAADSRE